MAFVSGLHVWNGSGSTNQHRVVSARPTPRTSFTGAGKARLLASPRDMTVTATPRRVTPARAPMRMQYGAPSAQERALSIVPYLVPLLDCISYGRFVFRNVPQLGALFLTPLAPLLSIYRGIPFVAFGIFLLMYFLVVRNPNVSRYIRWNTQQAILLDIVLIIPQLFSNLGGQVPLAIVETLSNTVFYGMVVAVGYAAWSNAKGEVPNQIPGISSSVDQMLGPF